MRIPDVQIGNKILLRECYPLLIKRIQQLRHLKQPTGPSRFLITGGSEGTRVLCWDLQVSTKGPFVGEIVPYGTKYLEVVKST